MSNMSAPFGFGFSARFMTDQTMKFTGEGTPVFLRMANVDETIEISDVADIGFAVAATGSLSGTVGYTDYQIIPQPIVVETPSRRGLDAQESQLQMNKTIFQVSQTWVLQQASLFNFQNLLSVFRDTRVIGFVYAGEILSIESVWPEHAGGQIISWNVKTANPEVNVTG
jgi:hypothetical protein